MDKNWRNYSHFSKIGLWNWGGHDKYLVIAIKSERFGISFWYYTHSFYIQKSCMVLHLGQFDWKLAKLWPFFENWTLKKLGHKKYLVITIKSERFSISFWYFTQSFYIQKPCLVLHLGQFGWKLAKLWPFWT